MPPKVLWRRYMLRHLCLWAGCLSLSLSLLAGFYIYQARAVSAEEGYDASLQSTEALLGARISEIKKLQETLSDAARQESILDVVGGKQAYSRILSRMSALLNGQTWFQQLSLMSGSGKGSPILLKINGYSVSNETLGDFMDRLSFDSYFDEVVLSYSREGALDRTDQQGGEPETVIQFLIECRIL